MKTYHAIHDEALKNGSFCTVTTYKKSSPVIGQWMQGDFMGWVLQLPTGLKTYTVKEAKKIMKS